MEIRKLTSDEFYPLFKKLRANYFADTLWFSSLNIRTEHEINSFNTLYEGMKDRWELHLGLYENDQLIGWCSSHQTRTYELYMMNSVIFPEHRRKGLYTRLIQETLKKAKEAGFQIVTSQHVCTNNGVIIPKLKAGFKITGFEVLDEFGVTVKLTNYLNETRASAMEFRSGMEKPSPEMKNLFNF